MSSLKVISGLLCDEVRREMNGKLFAIGIYASRIFVASFPSTIFLTGFINVYVETIGEQRFKTRLVVDKQPRSEVEIALDTHSTGLDWYAIPFGPIAFDKPSTILLQWMVDGGKWKTFATVPIEIGPVAG